MPIVMPLGRKRKLHAKVAQLSGRRLQKEGREIEGPRQRKAHAGERAFPFEQQQDMVEGETEAKAASRYLSFCRDCQG